MGGSWIWEIQYWSGEIQADLSSMWNQSERKCFQKYWVQKCEGDHHRSENLGCRGDRNKSRI